VTTNFDRVLEGVFKEAEEPFDERVFGAKPDLFAAALHQDKRYLLKIHGDVLERTDRVLTLTEYEHHYGSKLAGGADLTRPLPRLLKQLFTSRTLLFLGCSLGPDRTLVLLKRVADEDGAPPPHFAIVPTIAEADMPARARFLAQHHVRPLWYPAGRHEAVETFLSALVVSRAPPDERRDAPFDVALRYSSVDQQAAARIAGALVRRGIKVWNDEHDERPGTPVFAPGRGTGASGAVAIFVSREAIESRWVDGERALTESLAERRPAVPVIPVLLDDVALPSFLRERHVVEAWRRPTEGVVDQLVWGITGVRPRPRPPVVYDRALVDRRLVDELYAITVHPLGAGRDLAPSARLLLGAFSRYSTLFVENNLSSALAGAIIKSSDPIARRVVLLGKTKPDEDADFLVAVEDSMRLLSHTPGFAVEAARYEGSRANPNAQEPLVQYLGSMLETARRRGAAIVPHPLRWPLFDMTFRTALQPDGAEGLGDGRLEVPVDARDIDRVARGSGDWVRALARTAGAGGGGLTVVQYPPVPFPFSPGLLRDYPLSALMAFRPFAYELCTLADATGDG
jgi:hypothetical protein